jgi:hypothetical protein
VNPPKHLNVRTGIALLLSILLLAACAAQVRTGWAGTSTGSEMAYRYAQFTGTERGHARAEAGQTMTLAYAATVAKGVLAIQVQSPENVTLWEATLAKSVDEQQVDLALSESGSYTLLVTGDGTAGDFALAWTVN